MTNDELVALLRKCATEAAACKTCELDSNPDCSDYLMKEAADAIEELSKRVPKTPHGALMDRDDFFATCPELVDGYKHITDALVVIPAEEGE